MESWEVLRQERKFLLSEGQYLRLESQFSGLLHEDPNNGPDGYTVRSLYFDTMYDRDYGEKISGVELRRKIRLRLYHPDDPFVLLELKQKQGSNQLKRSIKLERSHAIRVARGDYTPLLLYKDKFAVECYGLMNMHCYRPKVVVEYKRKAYILQENSIRVTFDKEIRGSKGHLNFFDTDPGYCPVLEPWKVIFEVKYNHFLPSYLRDILRSCNKSEISVSKYCLAQEIYWIDSK